MVTKRNRRGVPVVQAGAMADIAFLLLVFFLATTTIQEDHGLLVRLPRYDPSVPPRLTSGAFTVQLNADNDLLVEDTPARPEDLEGLLRAFVTSGDRSPKEAVVSLLHDRSTEYTFYLEVYDALLAGYRSLWNDAARERYGRDYAVLTEAQQRSIRTAIPMVISEAEPSDIRD